MSGYLKRLVSTAKGTGPSVHPLVKPVFSSASPDESALYRQGDNVKFASTSRRANGIPPEISRVHISRQTEGEQPNSGEAQINDIAQKLPQPATAVTVTNFQPLLTSNQPLPTLQAATPPAEPDLRAVQPSKQGTQGEQMGGPATNSSVYVPLLNTMPGLSRSDSIHTETATYSGARISKEKDRQLSAPAVKNGSDEIQIHIGRIEVTAVPPPAAAPKPKRGAKGPSLQDYLGRRDRRGS
jgi:hypothetical protein